MLATHVTVAERKALQLTPAPVSIKTAYTIPCQTCGRSWVVVFKRYTEAKIQSFMPTYRCPRCR